ncbi:unnamed protein product [Symbiodinium sp. CCMP2456]|nr:unnamed protein product [Symbiodinium sp. CCMP2456]
MFQQEMTAPVPHLPGFHLSSGLEFYRSPSVRVVSYPSAQSAVAHRDHKDEKQEWDNLLAAIQAHLAKGHSNPDPLVPDLQLSKRYEQSPKLRQLVKKSGGICKIIATVQFAWAFNEARTWKLTHCDEPSTTTASTGSEIRTPERWPEYALSQDGSD